MARKKSDLIGNETRSTRGATPTSSGMSTFRVGNHAGSLVNVAHALAALPAPRKSIKKQTQKFLIEDGVVTCMPHDLIERLSYLQGLARRNPGLVAKIVDPDSYFEAKLIFEKSDQAVSRNPTVVLAPIEELLKCGVAQLLRDADLVFIGTLGTLSKVSGTSPAPVSIVDMTGYRPAVENEATPLIQLKAKPECGLDRKDMTARVKFQMALDEILSRHGKAIIYSSSIQPPAFVLESATDANTASATHRIDWPTKGQFGIDRLLRMTKETVRATGSVLVTLDNEAFAVARPADPRISLPKPSGTAPV